MRIPHRLLVVTLLMFVWLSASYCTKPEHERILFDFESDSELDRFHWQCHTLFSLSDEHTTHEKKSLKLQLFPSDYPGLEPKLVLTDWKDYKTFAFDVYNPQEKSVFLTVRIDDRKNYPDYADRYNKTFGLKPGANTISVPIDNLIVSGTGRKLDTQQIYRIFVFTGKPAEAVVLYLDYFRLRQ